MNVVVERIPNVTDLAEARILPPRSDISTFAAGWSHIRLGNRSCGHCPEAGEPFHPPSHEIGTIQIAGLALGGAYSRNHKCLRLQNAPMLSVINVERVGGSRTRA